MAIIDKLQPNAEVPESQRFAKLPKTSTHPLTLEEQDREMAEPADATDWSLRDRGTLVHSGAPTRETPP